MNEDQLREFLLWVGHLAGLLGVLVSAVAVVARLSGSHELVGVQSGNVMQAGVAAMVLGCLGYLALLARRK